MYRTIYRFGIIKKLLSRIGILEGFSNLFNYVLPVFFSWLFDYQCRYVVSFLSDVKQIKVKITTIWMRLSTFTTKNTLNIYTNILVNKQKKKSGKSMVSRFSFNTNPSFLEKYSMNFNNFNDIPIKIVSIDFQNIYNSLLYSTTFFTKLHDHKN